MPSRIVAAARILCLVAIGAAVGSVGTYYYGQMRLLNASFANIYLAHELTAAKADFTMMRAIENGRIDHAYSMSEMRVISAVMAMHYFPGATDEARAAAHEFVGKVRDFYKEHPERRAALAKTLSGTPEVLEWIDSTG